MISKYDFMSVSDNFQSDSKIDKERIWTENWHFHQINAPKNVFSFIVYINFAPKCHIPLELSN
jgi:hypothetical protein